MVKVVVLYWIVENGKLLPGFKKAFIIHPYPSILQQTKNDWKKYLGDAYYNNVIEGVDNIPLRNLRFYVYMISQKPRHYECLFPGYKNGKILKVLEHGGV